MILQEHVLGQWATGHSHAHMDSCRIGACRALARRCSCLEGLALLRPAALCLLLSVVALDGCRSSEPATASVHAEARRQLEIRGRDDQDARQGVFGPDGTIDSVKAAHMLRTDSANTAWLRAHVASWGWPTAAQVGREAVGAAFLIVQHAVHDTAFMRAMMPHIEEAVLRGDLDGGDAAHLADRLQVKAGHPQTYGTQASLRDGRWVIDPIADSPQVDARRKALGLPPLAEFARLLDSMFTQSPTP